MKRFVLIDGNAIVHRAYHALPNFTTSKGEPVGAIYGFVSMLIRVIGDLKPDYLAVAFDRAAPTFRQALYVGYQATRPKMASDLSSQFAGVQAILEAFSVPIFAIDGYEADDIIGTIAHQIVSLKQNIEVIIVTGDRDMLQLVNSHVKVYMPIKGMSETKLFDAKAVEEKYGLEPHQVVDLKALMGDSSDNYPGVRGIGPKTASLLLQKYHTLEDLYKHLHELPEKQAKVLAEGAESAGLGKKLATIVIDAPVSFKLQECRFAIKDKQKAVETLKTFEFKTLTNRFLEMMGEKAIDDGPQKSTLKIKSIKEEKPNQLKLV